jgi:methyl-accepting chemotaxis protein
MKLYWKLSILFLVIQNFCTGILVLNSNYAIYLSLLQIVLDAGIIFIIFKLVSYYKNLFVVSKNENEKLIQRNQNLLDKTASIQNNNNVYIKELSNINTNIGEINQHSSTGIESAKEMEKTASAALEMCTQAQTSMEELRLAIERISESNKLVEEMSENVMQVKNKTTIIEEIVFKTQLLSFNASVESERAGEHGRGFSVVAQEVGNLALLSGRAAIEITDIVDKSIASAEVVTTGNKERVRNGSELVGKTIIHLEKATQSVVDLLQESLKSIAFAENQNATLKNANDSVGDLKIKIEKSHQAVENANIH